LHKVTNGIQVFSSILKALLSCHHCHSICYGVIIGHVNLRNEATKSDKVLSKGAAKEYDANHRNHTASCIHQNVASSFGVENTYVVTHETINNLETPRN